MEYKKINSIRKMNSTQEVYNFGVDGLENYIANGVVVHNCYVKGSKQAFQMDVETIKALIRTLWTSQKYTIRQFTLAVDNLPDDTLARDIMIQSLRTAVRMKKMYPDRKMEFHITVNSIRALQEYFTEDFNLHDVVTACDLISISNLSLRDRPMLHYIREYTRVNYNYLPSMGDLPRYKEMLEYVDISYFLLHKTALGTTQVTESMMDFTDCFMSLQNLSTELAAKVIVDSCVTDAVDFWKTNKGCSANISRLHIWPDGHVTGCPYNQNGGEAANTVEEVLHNMNMALLQYDFKRCTIPEWYDTTHTTKNIKPNSLRVIQ